MARFVAMLAAPAIQAIETEYAGVRFRSRLEARWAVFFDALGIRWQYEPEAYATPYGNYLPDFGIDSRAHFRGTRAYRFWNPR